MDVDAVMAWLEEEGSEEVRVGLERFNIPADRAFGIPMGTLKAQARTIGRSHELAASLWATGWYEARTLAAFVDEPGEVTEAQMDAWARDFDSWAICDTTCFHLFDRTPFAWTKVGAWAAEEAEFVRRAGWALLWALSVHDKAAPDGRFLDRLALLERAEPDGRPLVKKAMNMALRATGKRNRALNRAAVGVAERLAADPDPHRAWIGRHALRELRSAKVQARLGGG